jgi:hypothetical protein
MAAAYNCTIVSRHFILFPFSRGLPGNHSLSLAKMLYYAREQTYLRNSSAVWRQERSEAPKPEPARFSPLCQPCAPRLCSVTKGHLDIVVVYHRDTEREMPENSFERMSMLDGPDVDNVRDLYANLRKRLDRYAIIASITFMTILFILSLSLLNFHSSISSVQALLADTNSQSLTSGTSVDHVANRTFGVSHTFENL